MSSLTLPAGQAAQQARAQAIAGLRIDIAKEVFAMLVAGDYRQAKMAAAEQRSTMGYGLGADGDGEPLQFQVDLKCPAQIAVVAADVFLVELGLMQPPPKPAIHEGPR